MPFLYWSSVAVVTKQKAHTIHWFWLLLSLWQWITYTTTTTTTTVEKTYQANKKQYNSAAILNRSSWEGLWWHCYNRILSKLAGLKYFFDCFNCTYTFFPSSSSFFVFLVAVLIFFWYWTGPTAKRRTHKNKSFFLSFSMMDKEISLLFFSFFVLGSLQLVKWMLVAACGRRNLERWNSSGFQNTNDTSIFGLSLTDQILNDSLRCHHQWVWVVKNADEKEKKERRRKKNSFRLFQFCSLYVAFLVAFFDSIFIW